MVVRLLRILGALALCWLVARPALAASEVRADGHDLPCSALCRSWMGLDADEASVPAPVMAPVEKITPPPHQATSRGPARSPIKAAAIPIARSVPLPVPRPAALVPALRADPVAIRTAAMIDQVPAAGRDPVPSEPLSTTLAAVARPVPLPAPEGAVDRAGSLPPVSPIPSDPAVRAASSSRPDGTPWSVKLGIYAVLALMVAWGSRPWRARDEQQRRFQTSAAAPTLSPLPSTA